MPGTYRAARIWHPWRHLGQHYPHVAVIRCELPENLRATWTKRAIFLQHTLNQTERRCVLTHEIIHLERGPVPRHPAFAAMEERIVANLAARRLISLRALTDALHWVGLEDRAALADELWVDELTLRVRLRHLTHRERAAVNQALIQRRPWNMDL
ncbi:hypothetical protein [Nocardia puris]|uniref:hypothetical protein n=1 Tax=Nocardia puris TaxID=208602 RepID=UPI002E20D97E